MIRKTPIFSCFYVLLFLAVFLLPVSIYAEDADIVHDQLKVETESGIEALFNVEVALSSSAQSTGLMHRTSLDEDGGMLFVFSSEGRRSFWMKNTLIPLDILFLSSDGTIHHIHHMAKPQDESLITALRPSKAVLELNGGTAGKLGISEGHKVLHPYFRNVLDE